MRTHRNGGAAVVETLAAHGVDTIFGVPGRHNLEIYRHLRAQGITPITPRQEQGAGYAAEAYARVSGRPGVVVTTSGPGLTHAMTAAATAWAESQPVVVISPGPPTGTVGADLGQPHETGDGSAAMSHLVRWSLRAATTEEATRLVAEALASVRGGRPRPVHVEIPVDVLEQPWDGVPAVADAPFVPAAGTELVRRAAELLAGAERPLIIAGGGAVDASAEVTALAEALGAPVATTVNGKGVVAEGHPLSVGASVRLRALQSEAAGSDAVLVVGSELGDSDLGDGRITGSAVIRLDVDIEQLHKSCPADIPLYGVAAATVRALLEALPTRHTRMGVARAAALRMACRREALVDGAPFEDVNDAVRAALPPDGVLCGDSSQVTYLGSVHFFDMPAPRRFCYTPGFAPSGYGLPAGIGASVARPGSPVSVLLGDGALMCSVQELATAVALRLPLPIVVVDNGGYGEVRARQAVRGIDPVGVDVISPDFALLATALGAHGASVTDPDEVTELVSEALEADRPTLIHLRTD